MRSALVLLCLLTLSAVPARAEDWPAFRGPTGQGISSEAGLPRHWSATENIAWKTPISGEGWSSPIITGDRIVLTTATEEGESFRVITLNRRTGQILWNRQIFRQTLGQKEARNSFATPTPVTDGQRIYVVSFNGHVAALDLEGNILWTNRDVDFYSQHGLGVSPILAGDLLILPLDGSGQGEERDLGWHVPWDRAEILAFDKATGKVRWRARRGMSRIAHVTPAVIEQDGRPQLVSAAGDVIQGFDLATGELLWTVAGPGEGVVPSVVIGEGLAFTASGFGKPTIRAVRLGGRGNVTSTHLAWEETKNVPAIPSFVYHRPHLFMVSEKGIAACLEAATGRTLWRERLGGDFAASPVYADGAVWFLSEDGTMTIVRAAPEFEMLAQNSLGERCKASPAISQGQIFLRTAEHLYAIGTP